MWTKHVLCRGWCQSPSSRRSLQHNLQYASRRCLGMKDGLRGKNSFPHIIKYPKDYWPVPPGYEYVRDKIKLQQRLNENELNMLQIHWGLDAMGLTIFSIVIIIGSCMLALYPYRLRRERIDNQIMANWVAENSEFLEGSAVEYLIKRYTKLDASYQTSAIKLDHDQMESEDFETENERE
eukprot:CAMPEP_0202690380 /NCGR_PEP_ID=MMETSP1385-20130828/5380_1 /ASSEMBLY_ACC=CAM_ASM_000861 /TAXON_ID=933848 /ORGANISM="Elphidium margaritaceum" /LENGTH=179 /DNA_ID=CAMNT_0049345641 /DNA_START=36 /DNA_END=575 /DNA_ORIENTATION=+